LTLSSERNNYEIKVSLRKSGGSCASVFQGQFEKDGSAIGQREPKNTKKEPDKRENTRNGKKLQEHLSKKMVQEKPASGTKGKE